MTSTPTALTQSSTTAFERAAELLFGEVVLVLADADRLGIDLDEFGERVLQPPCDRGRAAQGYVEVRQFLSRIGRGRIDRGARLRHDDLGRRENHEYIGHAVSLVFVIVPDGSFGSGRNWSARLDDQLLGGFIQTDEGAIGIARLLVSFQHVFHGGDEAGVGVWRNHPLPIAVGLEDFFLESFRSCCRWPSRRCSIRRPSPRAGANSNARTPRAPASRSGRSISPPPPRRISAAGRSSDCICGSAPPRSLLRPVDAGCGRYC